VRIAYIYIFPEDTDIIPEDTYVTLLDTTCSAQDTDLIANLICEGLGDEGGDEDNDDGGPFGCFIATAAYDSPLHPYVKILRDFRNTYIMPNKLGRLLVYFYYKYSPFIEELITKHKALKATVRITLLPVIAFSYSMLYLGPVITAVMLVFIFALPIAKSGPKRPLIPIYSGH